MIDYDKPDDDPVVAEVRRIREEILARYGGDLHALIADAQRSTEEAARAGKKVSSPTPRNLEPQPASTKRAG
jgi:hypothetical protein